ncbi:ATPase, T2SS/T4P/T4SS family, partial [Thioclava electrotropha]|uniref:ATPase, T2SS/T4P/T4SS family n=1 Tax=Thioclava electrotropha TaxID=1549850 RepID=UPI0034DECA4C
MKEISPRPQPGVFGLRTVFSTIHTNDAPSTITRLVDMGIQPFLISATLEAVVALLTNRRVEATHRRAGVVDRLHSRREAGSLSLGVVEVPADQG